MNRNHIKSLILTKNMKLNKQRMYFAQHDPTSWPIFVILNFSCFEAAEFLQWRGTGYPVRWRLPLRWPFPCCSSETMQKMMQPSTREGLKTMITMSWSASAGEVLKLLRSSHFRVGTRLCKFCEWDRQTNTKNEKSTPSQWKSNTNWN